MADTEQVRRRKKTATTRKGKKALEAREPRHVETWKNLMLIHGGNTSQTLKDLFSDIAAINRGSVSKYNRKHPEARPFEAGGEQQIESLAKKSDSGVFMHASTSKKRPNNLIVGRLFNGNILDMLELGVTELKRMSEFHQSASAALGNKPFFIFKGAQFETEPKMQKLRSLLLDAFKGEDVSALNLAGADRAFEATCTSDTTASIRQLSVRLKRSGSRLPLVEVKEMGPNLSVALRRVHEPQADMAKMAHKEAPRKAEAAAGTKRKNVKEDPLQGRLGHVYLPRQDLSSISRHPMKSSKARKLNEGKVKEV